MFTLERIEERPANKWVLFYKDREVQCGTSASLLRDWAISRCSVAWTRYKTASLEEAVDLYMTEVVFKIEDEKNKKGS